jgi:hypothetical protein
MSSITVPSGIGEVSSEVATNRKSKGDPDAVLANAVRTLASQAKTDIEALEVDVAGLGGGGGAPSFVNLANLTNGGTIDEVMIFESGSASRSVTTLWVRPTNAVTADDTNYAAFTWYLRNAAGSVVDTASLGTKITGGTGDIAAFEAVTATVAWTVAAGGCISMEGQSIGTGTFPRAAYGAY